MLPVFFADIADLRLWYAVPLIVAVSLVYAATRHELMEPILRGLHGRRLCCTVDRRKDLDVEAEPYSTAWPRLRHATVHASHLCLL